MWGNELPGGGSHTPSAFLVSLCDELICNSSNRLSIISIFQSSTQVCWGCRSQQPWVSSHFYHQSPAAWSRWWEFISGLVNVVVDLTWSFYFCFTLKTLWLLLISQCSRHSSTIVSFLFSDSLANWFLWEHMFRQIFVVCKHPLIFHTRLDSMFNTTLWIEADLAQKALGPELLNLFSNECWWGRWNRKLLKMKPDCFFFSFFSCFRPALCWTFPTTWKPSCRSLKHHPFEHAERTALIPWRKKWPSSTQTCIRSLCLYQVATLYVSLPTELSCRRGGWFCF